MKRLVFALFLFVSVCCCAYEWNVNVGLGKTLIAKEGNIFNYSATFSTSFNFGVAVKFNSRYFTELKYTGDTARLNMFLVEHNFMKNYKETYSYRIYSLRYGLTWNNISFFVGLPCINSNKHTKIGYEIGLRNNFKIYKNFGLYTELRYLYAEKIIRRIVNTVIVDIGIKYKF